ncbi:MAG: ASKHA domain-containing protein, partial [Alphaproteobacteria bacterium]|nr:ASKHA domain-containing protein [Alphaproteobacteria bacterium]
SAGALNPQIRFGEDLMSRVSYIQLNPGSQPQLTAVVRGAIDNLIAATADEAGVAAADIFEAVIVGNPIMHHLFLDIDPSELGAAPFALALSREWPRRAVGVLAGLPPRAGIHRLPCIADQVGADAAAVTLSERPYAAKNTTLLVDIGTNAEIVFGNRKLVLAASSPTGPAFEGAEISCGQRAAPGAIERVRIDQETYAPKFKIIGADMWSDEAGFAEPAGKTGITGICGSGIVEAIAEMYLAGLITADGVIRQPPNGAGDHLVRVGRTWSYMLHRGEIEISVSQKDVRAIQLAKAALYAGARLLMDKLGVDEVGQIKLAGAFGSYIDPKYAMTLGLIPDCDLKKVRGIGNAASTGARMALLNRRYRHEIQRQVKKLVKVKTATEARFQEHFVNAMAFPNKVEPFTLLRAQVTLPAAPAKAPSRRRRSAKR